MKTIGMLALIGFLFLESCATPPQMTEQKEVNKVDQAGQQKAEVKKEKTIILRIPRIIKETFLFADDTVDEVRTYLYSADGKTLLKEELVDAATNEILETVEYTYEKSLVAVRSSFDKEKKLKGKKAYSYLPSGLLEAESFFDKKGFLQAVSKYSYDSDGKRIEWITVDSSGIPLGTTRYAYQDGRLQRIILLGPAGKTDLEIGIVHDGKGRKSSETYNDASGKTEKSIVYAYDDKGRLVSESTLSPNKVLLSKTLYHYSGGSSESAKTVFLDGKGKPKKSVLSEFAYNEEKKVIYE